MPTVKKRLRKIKDLLTQEQKHILDTALLLMAPVILTKITGQLFTLIIASFYGATDSRLNQFYIANTIPELMTTVLMTGALGTIIIPVLISIKKDDGEEAFYRMYSSILNATIITFSVISILIIIFAGDLVPTAINIVNPDTPPSQAELSNISNMMRALLIPQLLLGISVFISSGLNIYDRYILPQLSPLFYNLGRIIAIAALLPLFDYSPWALIIGTYFGSCLHLLIQIPLFRTLQIHYQFVIDWKDKLLREVLQLGLPRIIVLASDQIGLVANNFLSVAFLAGPATFNFAKSLYLVIPALFGYTFSNASYPTIARLFMEGETKKIVSIIHKTLNEMFFLSLPFVVILMVLRVPLVRLLFGIFPDTNFTLDNTYQVAWILLFFSFGLVFITGRWFVFNLFYASKNTVIPSIVSMFSLVSVITLSVLFTNFLSYNEHYALSTIEWDISHLWRRAEPTNQAGIAGISLAMSLVYTIEFVAMIFLFNQFRMRIQIKKLVGSIAKKFLAAGVMFNFLYFTYKTWSAVSYTFPEAAELTYKGSTSINLLILTSITVVPAFLLYFAVCKLLNVEELRIFRRYLKPFFRLGGITI